MVYQPLPPGFQGNIQKLLDLGLSKVAAGRPVSGQIISDEGGGRATVMIGGRQLTLNLGTGRVSVGQSFTAQLAGGRLVISLGSQQTSVPVESLVGQSVPRPLPAILSSLGAPTTPSAQVIAQSLLAAQIPLSAEVIKVLAEILPQITSKDAAVLVFLFSRGLPIRAEMFPTIQRLMGNRSKIGQGLAELDQGLDRLERKLDALEDRVVAIQRRQELADRRRNLSREFLGWTGDDSEEEKKQLAKGMEEAVERQSSSAEAVRFAGADGARLALSVYDLYIYLLALQQIEGLGLEISISSVLDKVNNLYEALAGQNLHNLPQDDPEQPHTFFFQVPIILEGEARTLELAYRQHSRHPEDGGVLTIRLELSQLGPIKIALDIRNEMLSVTITVTSADLKARIEPELGILQEALDNAGFRVASIGVVHGVVPSTLREEVPETAVLSRPPRGLDLRA